MKTGAHATRRENAIISTQLAHVSRIVSLVPVPPNPIAPEDIRSESVMSWKGLDTAIVVTFAASATPLSSQTSKVVTTETVF